ncbi:MAG: hypothetical protein JST64_10815 [Actinobacteria bacterium]|nr:hypothetical protein [Actinomycetota bacterium]
MADRHVVLGLARTRAPWFAELARWATTAVAPIEFVKTLTTEEARAVLGAGRPVSVVLLDGELPRLDRTVMTAAALAGVPVVLVGALGGRDWESLGCAARLAPDFERDQLVELLDRVARRLPSELPRAHRRVDLAEGVERGRLFGVMGTGGSGSSTVAMALAQSCAEDGDDVVLVDGCRRGDLAMYHDVGDVIPGLPELVELHRGDTADPDQIRSLEFDTSRGYRLLLGLRRPHDWAGLRSASITAAIDGLRRTHHVVVVDLDSDLDTEATTGSVDVEDRHAVALSVARSADAVVVVSTCDLRGIHGATRITEDLTRTGTPTGRIVVAANRAPRSGVARTRTARAIRALSGEEPPIVTFLRTQRGLASLHHTCDRLPPSMGRPLLSAIGKVPSRTEPPSPPTPERVRIGELGTTTGATA